MIAFCDRRGVIEFGQRCPRGMLALGEGPAAKLRTAVSAWARHAYDGKTLLVTGIPEADTDEQAFKAAEAFRDGLTRRLAA